MKEKFPKVLFTSSCSMIAIVHPNLTSKGSDFAAVKPFQNPARVDLAACMDGRSKFILVSPQGAPHPHAYFDAC